VGHKAAEAFVLNAMSQMPENDKRAASPFVGLSQSSLDALSVCANVELEETRFRVHEDQTQELLTKPDVIVLETYPQADCCQEECQDTQHPDTASDHTQDISDDDSDSSDGASFAGPEEKVRRSTPEQLETQQLPRDLLCNIPALSSFVVDAMAQNGWRNVDHTQVRVKECSGFEGRTFRISAEGSNVCPAMVAFHVLNDEVVADLVCKDRVAAAQAIFAASGISPPRLAEGNNWFIDCWIGNKVGGVYDLNRPTAAEVSQVEPHATATAAELGALLAKVHAIPIDWYEPTRASLRARHPALVDTEGDSHLWPFTARQEVFEALPDEGIKTWSLAGPTATSNAGARIVTTHGDFHPANIIRTNSGLQVIDFGLSCVTCAAKDLSWACEYFLHGLEEKRSFASAYLKASGYAAVPEEVDALLVDAECFALHSFIGVLFGQLDNLKEDPEHGLDEYFEFAAIAEDARVNASLYSEILEHGLFMTSRYQALL